ncbi:hypothetical protein N7513_003965 [Penicillium frequentans]|nr:hypothetical protein N7513_003965 [Penicillium glabrum]
MSDTASPLTGTDSRLGTMPPESTAPSSAASDIALDDTKPANGVNEETVQDGDADPASNIEELDHNTKQLMALLRTSSVFVAIMSEKMKKQQEEARQQAAARKVETPEKQAPQRQAAQRRQTRHSKPQDNSPEDTPTDIPTDTPPESEPSSKRGRGRPKKNAGKGGITNYFQKAKVEVPDDNPTVPEALKQAAEEFEDKPTVLGEQELVATQQPKLVSGGQMRTYQLEGLEWLKTLWMNGLCGILADEMGLGKTVQAISMIAFMKENGVSGPFLVVGPLSTVSNWVDEFKRWTPDIETVMYHSSNGKAGREAIRRKFMNPKKQADMDFPVVCTSYEMCINDRKFLGQYQWRYIVVDEGHRLKNMNCRLIKELLTYPSANRLLITGTPLQNNISELWSLLHFLLPDVFNDLDSFESWFDFSSVLDKNSQADLIEKRKRNLVSSMHAILKPFLLRRVKTDVEHSLPKKREYILYAPLTSEQKELYREIISGTGRQYLEAKALERLNAKSATQNQSQGKKRRRESSPESAPNKSAKTNGKKTQARHIASGRRRSVRTYKDISDEEFDSKLRNMEMGVDDEEEEEEEESEGELEHKEHLKNLQLAKKEISQKKMQNPVMQARMACNSPHNFYWPWDGEVDESLVSASGKMQLLDRLVPDLLKKGHKILIFSQFKVQLDIIQDWATTLRSWECCRIDGAIAQADRQAQIKAFNTDKNVKIFLLSTRAGGQGINLVAADTVILFDSDWNPQQDLQAQDRAHRIGQKKPVIVYRLATKGTVEQTLLEKADSKRRLERLVIQKGKFKSLLDNNAKSEDIEELRKVLGEDEFERFEAGADPASILSDKDLEILTDRSEEAYVRAEKGLDQSGPAFVAVETKRDAGETLLG